jgi:hypothetical protein
VIAMRLALSYDAANGDALGLALREVFDCRSCLFEIVIALLNTNVSILNGTGRPWQTLFHDRLLAILDEIA